MKPLLISVLLLLVMCLIGCAGQPANNMFTYHEAPECNTITKVVKKKCDDSNKGAFGTKCKFETDNGGVSEFINEDEIEEGDEVCVYVESN